MRTALILATALALASPLAGAQGPGYATHRFHLIEAGRHTSSLSADSTMKPDWTLLNYLYNAGRDEADKWLSRHRASVGHRSSVDLKARFLSHDKPGQNARKDASPVRRPA